MKTILVVDDFATNLSFIKQILADDYNVKLAPSGQDALISMAIEKPDMILLDIWMPEMDGIATLEKIRANEEWVNIPVVFITAQADMDNIIKGYKLGIDDIIVKPISPQILKDRIVQLLGK